MWKHTGGIFFRCGWTSPTTAGNTLKNNKNTNFSLEKNPTIFFLTSFFIKANDKCKLFFRINYLDKIINVNTKLRLKLGLIFRLNF